MIAASAPKGSTSCSDGVAATIVSTIADMNGILPHSMSEIVRSRDPNQLSP